MLATSALPTSCCKRMKTAPSFSVLFKCKQGLHLRRSYDFIRSQLIKGTGLSKTSWQETLLWPTWVPCSCTSHIAEQHPFIHLPVGEKWIRESRTTKKTLGPCSVHSQHIGVYFFSPAGFHYSSKFCTPVWTLHALYGACKAVTYHASTHEKLWNPTIYSSQSIPYDKALHHRFLEEDYLFFQVLPRGIFLISASWLWISAEAGDDWELPEPS